MVGEKGRRLKERERERDEMGHLVKEGGREVLDMYFMSVLI